VLIILADDLGAGDLSCCEGKDIRTPHVDSLFAAGMRMSNFYANCPVCSPTRAALLSGKYPENVGVPGVIRTHPNNSWGYLLPSATLLPALLKPAGYATAAVGKWHLGLQEPNLPNLRGFDHFHGFLGDMMDDYNNHRRHGINYMRLNDKEIDPKGHATDLFTQWACEYIAGRKGKDQPFLLYLAYNAPHTPIQPPPEHLQRVLDREKDITPKRARLVALIEHMDAGIGKVLAALKAAGMEENTLVIFTSDNGGDLPPGAFNGPWRAGKGTLYEGGIRVPAAIRWPGQVQPGSQCDRTSLTMDVVPTVLQVAGLTAADDLDGRGFLPALKGQAMKEPPRDLFWGRREGGGMFKGKTIECARRGDWKVIRSRPGAELELYNLAADPYEKQDLAGSEKDKLAEMAKVLADQQAKYAKVPWQAPG